jgi:hypothetical protein
VRVNIRTLALAACAVLLPATGWCADPPRREEGRAIAAAFAAELQGALQSALADGGPAAAIVVCRDEAPRIASALSREHGATVARTSLRFRNAANAPEPWQAAVLESFDATKDQATAAGGLEYFDESPSTGTRYMKAIPTGGLCLACHGTELADAVRAALDTHYPQDLARGYALGDIRGAFSVSWPVAPAHDR